MFISWIVLNVLLYGIGIFALSKSKEKLGSVLIIFSSVSILIPLLRLYFQPDAIWVILLIGAPLLFITNIVARFIAKRLQ